jgi:hypothetical protein
MRKHCAARLKCSTLREAERRIGLCGDATRAPHQSPKWLKTASGVGAVFLPQPFWQQSDKSSCRCPFKLYRRKVAQRRMQPLLVVDLVDELTDGHLGFTHVAVVIAINLFF